jgi:peptidoglycan/LPS O-acetylase OafA/YrhL
MNDFTAYLNNRYFASLDGVRFFSILAVVWHHSYPSGLPAVFSRGFLGVDMFFVLSGYLIVTLLLREKKTNHKKISLRNFYIRRALRIFPVYFGVLIALSIVYGLLKPNDPDSARFFALLPIYLGFVANWSLVHASNLGIYWSLATEEQFYLFWPVLEKFFSPGVILPILLFIIFINQCVNFGYLDHFFMVLYGAEHPVSLHILDATFTPICLGVLLAHLLNQKNSFLVINKYLRYRFASLVWFIVLLVIIALSSGDISGIKRLLIQLTMCIWLASLVIREGHAFQPIMTFYPVKRMGQISYGVYVYHMFALHIVREILNRYGIELGYYFFILGLLLTLFIAEMSFRLYESPILSLSKRFRVSH